MANGIRLQILSQEIHPKPLDHQYPLSKNYITHHPQNHYTKQKKLRWPLTRSVLFCLQPLTALLQKHFPVTNLLQWNPLNNASKANPEYQQLIKTIQAGFLKTRQLTLHDIQQYWEVSQCLSVYGGIVLLDQRLEIPKKLRNKVLHHLHSAHQGTTAMQSRASKTIYWPRINNHIKNMRDTCHSCSYNAPSHSKEPLILTPPPNWPLYEPWSPRWIQFKWWPTIYLDCLHRVSTNLGCIPSFILS